MKIKDLKITDHMNLMINEAHQYILSEHPELFESRSLPADYQQFIEHTKSELPELPVYGKQYAPVSLTSTPIARLIFLTKSDKLITFIRYRPDVKKYEFDDEGSLILFPAASNHTIQLTDLFFDTLLFEDVLSSQHFLTTLMLKFGEWNIKHLN